MSHPGAEPDEPEDRSVVRRRAIEQRLRSLPPIPTEEERRRNPMAMVEFQHELELCRRDDTVEILFRDEERAEIADRRAKAYETREADYQTHVSQLTALYRDGAAQVERLAARMDSGFKTLELRVDSILEAQQEHGTALEELKVSTRKRHHSVEQQIEALRSELRQEAARIDENTKKLDVLAEAFWADQKARANASTAQTEGDAPDPDGAPRPRPSSTP